MRPATILCVSLLVLGLSVCVQAFEYVVHQLQDPSLCEETGLRSSALDNLVAAVEAGEYGDIRTLLVSRRGLVALEMYRESFPPDSLQDLYSVTKSVLSTLVGIAIAEGYIDGVDEPVLSFFPEYDADMLEPGLQKITLGHALSMSAGIDWDSQLDFVRMVHSPDWVEYVLTRPLSAPPGVEFCYNSGLSHLIAEILYRTTGQTPEELAAEWLFAPLGIEEWRWEEAPNGVSNGGAGLRMKPRDLLKIGELCASGGILDGDEIIPTDWLETSTVPRVPFDECWDYAYHWWTYTDCFSDQLDGIYVACGMGEQRMWIAPHLELVVVATALNAGGLTSLEPLLWEHVLPAVIESPAP
jgi:CubicO group peptidase (beta-lactamase class C family)